MLSVAVLASALVATEGFAPITSRGHISTIIHHDGVSAFSTPSSSTTNVLNINHHNAPAGIHRTTKLHMADDNNEGPGLGISLFISAVLLYFVASAFAPFLLVAEKPAATDISLGDSVVTRQDGDNKMKNYQSKFDALSPAKIQEKLSNLPVFYLSSNDGAGGLGDNNFYLSFNEAESAAAKVSSGKSVKVTTLDQVMYPLVLKRGTMKTVAKTPVEIKNAREAMENDGQSSSYSLVPSTAAVYGAKDMTLKEGDVPLFVVERLAFAGNDGRPQVPLFTEKGDAITSYSRLRESGGNKLPEEPSLRTTSLFDVLESMEKGTRPAVGQLQFYGNADDVLKADEMSQ